MYNLVLCQIISCTIPSPLILVTEEMVGLYMRTGSNTYVLQLKIPVIKIKG